MRVAAADHVQLFKLANGEPRDRELAEKQSKKMGEGQLARFRGTLPCEAGVVETLLPDEKYDSDNENGSAQSAIPETVFAADLIGTAEFDPAAVCVNLGRFMTALSPRGVGFADDHFRHWPLGT